MKVKAITLVNTILAAVLMGAMLFSAMSTNTTSSVEYNPWLDSNDDGNIDLKDVFATHLAYGATGIPITKASKEYDSDWMNITDHQGQFINLAHNLNITDFDNPDTVFDITGKTTSHSQNLLRMGQTRYTQAWNRTYGGAADEKASCVVQTGDGGYVLAGVTYSFGTGYADFWLAKIDVDGNLEWNQTYGGTETDHAYSVVETSDDGYAVAGETASFGAGFTDAWLIKTDSHGGLEWNQTYGGTYYDGADDVVQTGDGGHVLAGTTGSFGAGSYDFWLVKTDAYGNMLWNRTYGGIDWDEASCVVETGDGGYAVAGRTYSFGAGGADAWLIKIVAGGPGLVWTGFTVDALILYRVESDPYWNYVRVRVWRIKETP